MTTIEREVLDEGNCGGAIQGGEEACGCRGKRRVCRLPSVHQAPPGCIHVKAAKLRTETSYKAGSAGESAQHDKAHSSQSDQVNDELARRNITLLSGETCQAACEPSFAPASKHLRLKGWNTVESSAVGEAGVSRGRSTELPIPTGTGRTER